MNTNGGGRVMLQAIPGSKANEAMEVSMLESINDTDYPLVIDDDQNVAAVVLVYGEEGYALARVVAAAMQAHEAEAGGGLYLLNARLASAALRAIDDCVDRDQGEDDPELHEAANAIRARMGADA